MSPENRPRVAGAPATEVDFPEMAAALKALAYDKRLEVLHLLTRPHYLEEIASHLGIARQAAQKHVDQLLEAAVIKKQQGRRESGPVVEYVVVPQRLFALSEEFAKLGVLKPVQEEERLARTQVTAGKQGRHETRGGPALVAVHGMKAGEVHPLGPGEGPWTIGRDGDRTISLDYDPFASNRHAEVARTEVGFELVDTFSTNGTYLNWNRLDRGERVPLRPGDVVGVGKSLLVFRA